MTDLSPSLDMELTDLNLSAQVEESVAQRPDRPTDIVSLPKAKHMSPVATGFDYSGVPKSIAKEAEATAMRIRDRLRANTIETGKELLNIKQKLEHGKFGKWLEFHFGWKERTAQNYMNSAIAFGSRPQVIDVLPPSTVYKLAAKSTPRAFRQAVIEEINRGASLDPKTIEKRITEIKTEARLKAESNESARSGEDKKVEIQSTPAVGGEAHGAMTIDPPVSVDLDMVNSAAQLEVQAHEASAKKIAELLKKSLGPHFDTVRDVILRTDYTTLKQALAEA